MISRYNAIYILLLNVNSDFSGEGSSNRNASRDESVETGMNQSKPGKKHNNHVKMWCRWMNVI